jgi:hypothetical protein
MQVGEQQGCCGTLGGGEDEEAAPAPPAAWELKRQQSKAFFAVLAALCSRTDEELAGSSSPAGEEKKVESGEECGSKGDSDGKKLLADLGVALDQPQWVMKAALDASAASPLSRRRILGKIGERLERYLPEARLIIPTKRKRGSCEESVEKGSEGDGHQQGGAGGDDEAKIKIENCAGEQAEEDEGGSNADASAPLDVVHD